MVCCQNPAGSTPVVAYPVASISKTAGVLFDTVNLTVVPTNGATIVWTQTAGTTVSITGSTTAAASFIPSVAGTYTFNVSENGVASLTPVSVVISDPLVGTWVGHWTAAGHATTGTLTVGAGNWNLHAVRTDGTLDTTLNGTSYTEASAGSLNLIETSSTNNLTSVTTPSTNNGNYTFTIASGSMTLSNATGTSPITYMGPWVKQ